MPHALDHNKVLLRTGNADYHRLPVWALTGKWHSEHDEGLISRQRWTFRSRVSNLSKGEVRAALSPHTNLCWTDCPSPVKQLPWTMASKWQGYPGGGGKIASSRPVWATKWALVSKQKAERGLGCSSVVKWLPRAWEALVHFSAGVEKMNHQNGTLIWVFLAQKHLWKPEPQGGTLTP